MTKSTVTFEQVGTIPTFTTLGDIHEGTFCWYKGALYLVFEDGLIDMDDGSILYDCNGDIDWDDPCFPVEATVTYRILRDCPMG